MQNIQKIIIETLENESFNIIDSGNLSETELFGGESELDSLGFVTFIVSLEQNIEDKLGIAITIADEKAMSLKNSPFRTIGSLDKFINDKISDVSNE